jgi:DNA-binding NtrC family response regulator
MRPRILVVDDELFIRELLEEFLNQSGYSVATAAESHEAIRKVQLDEYDAVLVDLRIGESNGFDLLHNIRLLSPDSAILPMTGYPSVETARTAIRCGAFDYVVKPFKLGELAETVEAAVAECRRRYETRQVKERLTELEAKIAAMNVRESKKKLTLKHSPEVAISSTDTAVSAASEADSLGSRLTRIRRNQSIPAE